jgi:predicted secreted hydrolase
VLNKLFKQLWRAVGAESASRGTLGAPIHGRFVAACGVALAILASQLLSAPRAALSAPTAGHDLSAAPSKPFTPALAPYRFSFPRDHAAHTDYQSEWWYYTGHVKAKDGRRFGYELTFFRVGLKPGDPATKKLQSKWRGNEVYPAHFALTDESGKTFVHYERFAREALGAGRASTKDLDVRVDDWYVKGDGPMLMHASAGGNSITFSQVSEKPPAIHGHDGVSKKGPCRSCASHYYSLTRLHTTGTLVFGGKSLAVDGLSWMDHEFGSDELQKNQAGWDWFAIQLDDKREVMLYRLRQKDGSVTPQSSGSVVAPNGAVTYLPLDAFSIAATGSWKSPHTGGTYPSGWRVTVPGSKLDLTIVPTLLDQELSNTTGGISYWEGAVDVKDSATGRVIGVGYVELTGYAGAISL